MIDKTLIICQAGIESKFFTHNRFVELPEVRGTVVTVESKKRKLGLK